MLATLWDRLFDGRFLFGVAFLIAMFFIMKHYATKGD